MTGCDMITLNWWQLFVLVVVLCVCAAAIENAISNVEDALRSLLDKILEDDHDR